MKLGNKIALITSGIVVAMLTALGAVATVQDANFLAADTTRDQAVLGNVLGASVERELAVGATDDELDQFLHAAVHRDRKLGVTWGWVDQPPPDWAGAAGVDAWADVGSGHTATFRADGSQPAQWTIVPGKSRQGRRFYVALTESLDQERGHLRAGALRTALAMSLLAALCSIAMILIGRRLITRPVKQLVEHARRVASGDFGKRLSLRQHDEIGDLATEMNAMAAQLGASHEKLESETRRRIATVEQLRHADRLTTVGKLASGLAHELGTPLNVVLGYGRLIADRRDADEELKASANAIVGQADKMTRLVRQLLDFARRRGPNKESVELAGLAARVTSVLAPTARKKGVALMTKAAESIIVPADPTMIEQVVTNLTFNALQASAEGGQPIEVAVSVVAEVPNEPAAIGKYARIEVRDHGAGISPDNLSRVFEPFFTTKDVGEGTGLGLSVTYGIVHDHKGFISVESIIGEGTTFRVYLPMSSSGTSGAQPALQPPTIPTTATV